MRGEMVELQDLSAKNETFNIGLDEIHCTEKLSQGSSVHFAAGIRQQSFLPEVSPNPSLCCFHLLRGSAKQIFRPLPSLVDSSLKPAHPHGSCLEHIGSLFQELSDEA
jgi:hypothetical protein